VRIPVGVRIGVMLLVVTAGAVLAYWWQQPEQPDGAIVLYGNVDIRQVQLAFKTRERISQLDVEEGEHVSAGQPLAALDSSRFTLALQRAEARVAAQREQLAALEAGTRPQEIRTLQAETEAARVTAANSRRSYERLKQLAAQKLVPQEQVDLALAAADADQARWHAAQQRQKLAEIGPRTEEINAARATLNTLLAERALAELDLAETRLEAPTAGVIENRILEVGDIAAPDRPVLTLALNNPLWVRAYLPEPLLGQVHPGMRAGVYTDSYPDKRYPGWVGFISPTAEFTPKTVQTEEVRTRLVYQLRVMVCNPQGELRLGMPARVELLPLTQATEQTQADPGMTPPTCKPAL